MSYVRNRISKLIWRHNMSPDVKGGSVEWKRIYSQDLLAT
jgi:hypothetical protein